jgi:hypothetical protein
MDLAMGFWSLPLLYAARRTENELPYGQANGLLVNSPSYFFLSSFLNRHVVADVKLPRIISSNIILFRACVANVLLNCFKHSLHFLTTFEPRPHQHHNSHTAPSSSSCFCCHHPTYHHRPNITLTFSTLYVGTCRCLSKATCKPHRYSTLARL